MEWVNTIVLIIGLIILGWYQNKRIKILEQQINTQSHILNSQGELLKSVKLYVDLFDPDKFDKLLKITEDTFEKQKHLEIGKIKTEMQDKLQKRKEGVLYVMGEYLIGVETIFNLLFYVSQNHRKVVYNKIKDSKLKNLFSESMETFPYVGDQIQNALSALLVPLQENDLTNVARKILKEK